jgi:serine/threonine protein kinase
MCRRSARRTSTLPAPCRRFPVTRSSVYLAEEERLDRRVAIKVVSRRIAENAEAKNRFLREAKTLATIEHPHERISRLGTLPVDDAGCARVRAW